MNKLFLSKCRTWFYEQKYIFDISQQFMSLISFGLLMVTSSPVFSELLGIENSAWFIASFVFCGYFVFWLVGLFLVKVVKHQQNQEVQAIKNSILWNRILNDLDTIKKEMKTKIETYLY